MKRTEALPAGPMISVLQDAGSGGLKRLVARGISWTFLVNIIGKGLRFGVAVLVARLAGEVHFGYYAYSLAWLQIPLLFCVFGGAQVLMRYIPQYEAKSNPASLRGVMRHTNSIAIGVSVVLGAGAIIFLLSADGMDPVLRTTLLVGVFLLPFRSLTALNSATLRAFGRVILAKAPESLIRPAAFAIALLAVVVLWGQQTMTGPMVMGVQLGATVIALLIGLYWMSGRLPAAVRKHQPEYHRREWVGVAKSMWLIRGSHLIKKETDVLMLGILVGPVEAGIYAAVTRTTTVIIVGLEATRHVIAPLISSLYASGQHKRLQRMLDGAALLITGITGVVSLPILLLPGVVMGVFGPEFVKGATALQILVISQIVNATAGPIGITMTMTGNQKAASRAIGGAAVLNVVLNLALIPPFGMIGAAVATATGNILWNVGLAVYAWRRVGLRTAIWIPRKK